MDTSAPNWSPGHFSRYQNPSSIRFCQESVDIMLNPHIDCLMLISPHGRLKCKTLAQTITFLVKIRAKTWEGDMQAAIQIKGQTTIMCPAVLMYIHKDQYYTCNCSKEPFSCYALCQIKSRVENFNYFAYKYYCDSHKGLIIFHQDLDCCNMSVMSNKMP